MSTIHSLELGMIIGVVVAVAQVLFIRWRDQRKQHKKVFEDFKRYGYHQVTLDDIEIKVNLLRSDRGALRFSAGLFSFEVVLEKLPKEDADGYQWLPFLKNSKGGRKLISTTQFNKMIDIAIEATQASHNNSLSVDARRTGSPI